MTTAVKSENPTHTSDNDERIPRMLKILVRKSFDYTRRVSLAIVEDSDSVNIARF